MDIKINSTNFSGAKEVIYGLTKAAQKAKNYEYYNQPAIAACLTCSKEHMQTANEASMKAYLDMALRDQTFAKAIDNIRASELYILHNLLKPEQTQYTTVKPMNKFKEAIQEVTKEIGRRKFTAQEAIDDLFKKLEL